jgi:hypothetical protein
MPAAALTDDVLQDLTAVRLRVFHDDLLARPLPDAQALPAPWGWIERNHRCNILLWDEEDRARRTDVPDAEIVRCKRSIDRANQQRNDAVEAFDTWLLEALAPVPVRAQAQLHSETPGAMIDRLSILSLKLHHMGRQARRAEAGATHTAACAAKCERLALQRSDLGDCLDRLLHELRQGQARFRLYRQFKMYNDPSLNPWLQGGHGQAAAR